MLAVLVLAVVALAIVRAGNTQVGALGYTILGVVAAVALVALIVALALGKPPRVTIKTGGDYSPGVVGGDYAVSGGEAPPPTRKRARDDPTGSPGAISIETEGSHSPGRVGGNFNVQEDPPA